MLRPMNDKDLKAIEKELGVTLPTSYVQAMKKFPDELRTWPPAEIRDASQEFFADAEQVLDANRRFRDRPQDFVKSPTDLRAAWPAHYLVIGRVEQTWKVIDVSQKEPRIFSIDDGVLDTYSSELKAKFDLWKYIHKELWKAVRKKEKQAQPAKEASAKPRSKPKQEAAVGPMTEAQFKELEEKLELKLPAAYRKIMGKFPNELRNWPPPATPNAKPMGDDFLFDVAAIVKANKLGRKRLKKQFPAKGFVLGGGGDSLWMIDTAQSNPPVKLLFDEMILDGPDNLAELVERVQANHKDAWAKVKKREKAGAKADLSPETLLAEGRKLARPAVALYDKGKEYAAVWGGKGVVPPGKPSQGEARWKHWISIDASRLPDNPRKIKGVVSVYEWLGDDKDWGAVKVYHDPKAALPRKPDGVKLFARKFQCLPDVDAVFHFGSKTVKDWLKANSLDTDSSYEVSPVKEYLEVVRREHPFMSRDGAYAMLGGWSWCFTWCYGMDEKYPWHVFKKALIVLTIADSEPWLEVFDDGKKFVTFSRIT